MLDLLSLHKYFLSEHLKEGGAAVDFTMGNGYDTQFLSESVGKMGKVYAFDIQEQAKINTEKRLIEAGCPNNWTLILDSHENAQKNVSEQLCAGIFNLGWLPGSDKSVTTSRSVTLPAVKNAVSMLDFGGILLVAVYPGHEEGKIEGEMLEAALSELSKYQFCAAKFRIVNSPDSPYFFVIEKKGR